MVASMLANLFFLIAAILAEEVPANVDFDTEVMPLLTRAGCNAGACHGAAAGRGGLQLSLFGSDPSRDWKELRLELSSRRIDFSQPQRSLLLTKPTEQLEHGGGVRFASDSPEATLLKSWIAQGAMRNPQEGNWQLETSLDREAVTSLGQTVQLSASLKMKDGTTRDVIDQALIQIEDSESLRWNPIQRTLEVLRPGAHSFLVRFANQVRTLRIVAPVSATDNGAGSADGSLEGGVQVAANSSFIDRAVQENLWRLGIRPGPKATAEIWLRRVHLDLLGRLPTVAERERWLAALSGPRESEERSRLVEEMLQSSQFKQFWAFRFGKLLKIDINAPGFSMNVPQQKYFQWVHGVLMEDRSILVAMQEMLSASGRVDEVGEVNFFRTMNGPREMAEHFSETLLGIRLRCANCHDHPLDRWTQDDYHGLAAIFATVSSGPAVESNPRGKVSHPKTGEAAKLRLPGDRFLTDDELADARQVLANWIAQEGNQFLATSLTNRVWKELVGRGIVEPVDDLRATNLPSNPQLLKELTKHFQESGFRIRPLIAAIVLSDTYARQVDIAEDWNSLASVHFAHGVPKPLDFEVYLDALDDVTLRDEMQNDPQRKRWIAPSSNTPADRLVDELKVERANSRAECQPKGECLGENPLELQLTQQLSFINGPVVNQRIEAEDGWLKRQLTLPTTSNLNETRFTELIERLYLRVFLRMPTDREIETWRKEFEALPSELRSQFWVDLMWSLLTSREFRTNH